MSPNLAKLFEQSKIRAKRNTVADDVQQAAGFRVQSLLRTHGEALIEVLEQIRESIEMEAADIANECGLGAGEWEAFIHRTRPYQQWKQICALLATLEREAGEGS